MAGPSQRPGQEHEIADASLAGLFVRPYRLQRPFEQRVPFVFASPHSGRLYPASFVSTSRLSPLGLRRSEDAYADELFSGAVALGAPMIAASFPRAFLDVNRAPGELDPSMFDAPLELPVEPPNARVNAGLGVIPRIVRDGAEIYAGKLAPLEAELRIGRLHRPYHAALSRLVEETLARFGAAVVIDCHSMPSAPGVPQIVLGDRFGVASSAGVTRHAERAFEDAGFHVARNAPYAGGYTTLLHGRPDSSIHALQIEINRSLYLDEERIELHSGFEAVRFRLNRALAGLTGIDPALLLRAEKRLDAAE